MASATFKILYCLEKYEKTQIAKFIIDIIGDINYQKYLLSLSRKLYRQIKVQ